VRLWIGGLVVAVAVVCAGCGSGDHLYSAKQVAAAFAKQGLPVVPVPKKYFTATNQNFPGVVLYSKHADTLVVSIYQGGGAESQAQAAFARNTKHGQAGEIDRLLRNIYVLGSGLTPRQERQVSQAITLLASDGP
jgi:methylmalonyl-CoA mutase cobalamin-binding subunit